MNKPIHLTKNVREDFTIDDTVVETYLILIDEVKYDKKDKFFRFFGDNGATNVEFRLSKKDITQLLKAEDKE